MPFELLSRFFAPHLHKLDVGKQKRSPEVHRPEPSSELPEGMPPQRAPQYLTMIQTPPPELNLHVPNADPFVGGLRKALHTYLRVRHNFIVKGADNIPSEGAFILATNHASHLDTPIVFSALNSRQRHNTCALGAADYFFQGYRRYIVRYVFNVVPINRNGSAREDLTICLRLLLEGNNLLVFPEGTRSRNGQMGEFKPGVALLSLKANVPVIPAYIRNSFLVMPPGSGFPRAGTVSITFSEAIYPDKFRFGPKKDQFASLSNAIQREIFRLAHEE